MALDAVIYAHIYTHLKRLVTVNVLRWVCGTRQTQTKTHTHTAAGDNFAFTSEKGKNAAFVLESSCCVFFLVLVGRTVWCDVYYYLESFRG